MSDDSFGRMLVKSLIITAVPIGVALLMQRPELRQRLAMRTAHGAKTFCQRQADFWQDMALKAGTAYNKARL
jgi:hypothetical protein